MAAAQQHPAEGLVRAIQIAGVALEKHEKQAAEHQKAAAEAEAKIPEVVETLIRFGRIEPEEKQAAAAALRSHSATLELLKQAAMSTAGVVEPMGQPSDVNGRHQTQKRASVDDGLPPGGYVGRPTGQRSEAWEISDRRLFGG